MLRAVLSLGWSCLFSPTNAARASRKEENLIAALWVYAAFTAGYFLFLCLKPWDFPQELAVDPGGEGGAFFWLKVSLWQPPLEAAWVMFLMGLVVWFRQGALPVKMAGGVLWVAAQVIMIVVYKKTPMPKLVFAAACAVWAGLFYPLIRQVEKTDWKPVITFMLGINAIGLVLFLPMLAAVWMRSDDLYQKTQILGGLWMLGAGTLGLRELTGLRLPRAFMAMLLSIFFQALLAFSLFMLGAVPKEILKALFYA